MTLMYDDFSRLYLTKELESKLEVAKVEFNEGGDKNLAFNNIKYIIKNMAPSIQYYISLLNDGRRIKTYRFYDLLPGVVFTINSYGIVSDISTCTCSAKVDVEYFK